MSDVYRRLDGRGKLLLKTAQGASGLWLFTGDDGSIRAGMDSLLTYDGSWHDNRWVSNADGTCSDKLSGLMYTRVPHAIIPGAVGVTGDNLMTGAFSDGIYPDWKVSQAFTAGLLVRANVAELGAYTASSSTTTITATGAYFALATHGYRFVSVTGRTTLYPIIDVKSTTKVSTPSAPSPAISAAACGIKSWFVCCVGHTSRASGTFMQDVSDHPTYWREVIFIKPTATSTDAIDCAAAFYPWGADNSSDPQGFGYVTNWLNVTAGGFAGHTDWRVPNFNELLNIFNIGYGYNGWAAPFVLGDSLVYASSTNTDPNDPRLLAVTFNYPTVSSLRYEYTLATGPGKILWVRGGL